MRAAHRKGFQDPTGPGTPAWEQFDLAVATWKQHYAPGWTQSNPRAYKKFHNHRARCMALVSEHGEDPTAWMLDLAVATASEEE